MEFPFEDAPNTATLVCCHVLEKKAPILFVTHDEEDGMWQFLCGCSHQEDEGRVISLRAAYELDHSVGVLAKMPYGWFAQRNSMEDEWEAGKVG